MTDEPRRLDEAREKRAYVRMQIKVTQRLKERRLGAGEPVGDLDQRLLDLDVSMGELDELVEGLRAKLGRAHRQLDRG
jgi:hypothetical protein